MFSQFDFFKLSWRNFKKSYYYSCESYMSRTKEIVFVGSKGIPAKYGGFEEAVQQIALRLSKKGYKVRVYSTDINEKRVFWNNIELVKVKQVGKPNIDRVLREFFPLIYELINRIIKKEHSIIIHGCGPFLLLFLWKLFGFKIVYSTDGLEWKRRSYSIFTKIFTYIAYLFGSKFADIVSFDAYFIRDYYKQNIEYKVKNGSRKNLSHLYIRNLNSFSSRGAKKYLVVRVMVERPIEELLRKYLGISVPRVILGILMIIFAILILIEPELVAYLIALYLLIAGIFVLVDELLKSRRL